MCVVQCTSCTECEVVQVVCSEHIQDAKMYFTVEKWCISMQGRRQVGGAKLVTIIKNSLI